jgi:hypothetical protein
MWRLDAIGKPFMTEFIITWVILVAALVFAAPVIFRIINDSDGSELPSYARAIADSNYGEAASGMAQTTTANPPSGSEDVPPLPTFGFKLPKLENHPCGRLEPRDEVALSRAIPESRPASNAMLTLREAVFDTATEANQQELAEASRESCRS